MGKHALRMVLGLGLLLRGASPAQEAGSETPGAHAVRVSSGVMAGRKINNVQPVFPCFRKDDKISGAVILHAFVAPDGHIEKLDVIAGPEALRGPVLDAVRQWRYRPYVVDGVAVSVETTIGMDFAFGLDHMCK